MQPLMPGLGGPGLMSGLGLGGTGPGGPLLGGCFGGLPGGLTGGLTGGLPGMGGLGPGLPGLGMPGMVRPGGMPGLGGAGLLGGLPGGLMRPGPSTGGLPPPLVRPLGGTTMASLGAATSKASTPVASVGALPRQVGLMQPLRPNVATPVGSSPQNSEGTTCTVYVGRISSEVSDDFVKTLLEKCGKISKWNRAADPNTSKLTSFGFCDFEEPEGVWRALEYLHEKQLCDKRLLVKCEERAKQTIDEWKAKKKVEIEKKRAEAPDPKKGGKEGKEDAKKGDKDSSEGDKKKEEGEEKKEDEDTPKGPLSEEQVTEALRKDSKAVEDELARLLREKNKGFPEVSLDAEPESKDDASAKTPNGSAAKDDKKKDDPSSKDRKRSRSRATRSEERRKKEEEEKNKKPPAVSRHYRVSRRERDRELRVRDRERDIEKEYQYRIREFERGEEKRISSLKRSLRDLEIVPELSEREKRKFEDADLDFGRSDRQEREWKRYREDRLDKRQREQEKDAADRAAEAREAEDEKRKVHEEEKRKKKEEEEAKRKAKEEAEEEKRRQKEEERRAKEEQLRKEQEEIERKKEEERKVKQAEQKKAQEAAAAKLLQSVSASVQQEIKSTSADGALNMAIGGGGQKPAQQGPMAALFREGDEPLDANGQPRKHKPLTRLDGAGPSGDVKQLRDDEMRRLIQQVPTDKAKAFAFEIDWQSVEDHNIVEKKLRPWVKKKVTEYMGEEEQGMIDFIIRKVNSRTSPGSILDELEGFLDEEAENFTLKMWRMLIFEVLRVKAR